MKFSETIKAAPILQSAPSVVSEASASSLPSEAIRLDLDYNRLRAEHRKLKDQHEVGRTSLITEVKKLSGPSSRTLPTAPNRSQHQENAPRPHRTARLLSIAPGKDGTVETSSFHSRQQHDIQSCDIHSENTERKCVLQSDQRAEKCVPSLYKASPADRTVGDDEQVSEVSNPVPELF